MKFLCHVWETLSIMKWINTPKVATFCNYRCRLDNSPVFVSLCIHFVHKSNNAVVDWLRFMAHLVEMSLCNHELSIISHPALLLSLVLSVDSPPSHRFDHRNFTSWTCMHIHPSIYEYELVNEYSMDFWNGSHFSQFICVALLTTWLSLEPSYFTQLWACAGVHTHK